MSSDLHVRLSHPVAVEHIWASSNAVLQRVLCLREPITLTVTQIDDGIERALYVPTISHIDDPATLFCAGSPDDSAHVVTFHVGQTAGHPMDYEVGLWAGIGASRSELGYAVAACVAIAIGQLTGSPIHDPALDWTGFEAQSADEFARRISLDHDYGEAQMAAQVFYARLPVENTPPAS